MGSLAAVLYIVDANGNRVFATRPDGSKAPVVLKIGSGLAATATKNGGVDVIELTAPAPEIDVEAGLGLTESPENTLNVAPSSDGSIELVNEGGSYKVQVGILAEDEQH